MTRPGSWLLCGTPRTGSTLLCSLVESTGVLGRPESYFREPDEEAWARRLGVATRAGRVVDYPRFARAIAAAATTPNGVFAARIMSGSIARIVAGLGPDAGQRDLDLLEDAFGSLSIVHLRRRDVVAQAVSWAKAEQTGHWQQGDATGPEPRFDLDQVRGLVRTIRAHDRAWSAWFDRQVATPMELVYEDMIQAPHAAVALVADLVGVSLPTGWEPTSPHARQADEVNEDWNRRTRAALDDPA